MKNIRTRMKFQILIAVVLLLGVSTAFSQESRYKSDTFNIAFQTPHGAVKSTESTAKRIVYTGETGKSGVAPRLELVIDKASAPEEVSRLLGTEKGMEQFISGAMASFKEELGGTELKILEKKRVQLAKLNAVKLVASATVYDVKLRLASFTVVVPEHARMYNFIIIALDSDFDKWLPIAQASVDSFEVLTSVHK